MLTHEIDHRTGSKVADPVRQQTIWELAAPGQTPLSDAPVYAPPAAEFVLLLVGPKEPRDPKRPKVGG